MVVKLLYTPSPAAFCETEIYNPGFKIAGDYTMVYSSLPGEMKTKLNFKLNSGIDLISFHGRWLVFSNFSRLRTCTNDHGLSIKNNDHR